MKILFVCQRNNGRSQMAKGLYNKLAGTQDADSAGITVDKNGQTLQGRASEPGSEVQKVIDVMAELDVNVSEFYRMQLDIDKFDTYDKVVTILSPDKIPEEVKAHPKVEIWDISDPKVKDLNGVRETRDEIEQKIRETLLS